MAKAAAKLPERRPAESLPAVKEQPAERPPALQRRPGAGYLGFGNALVNRLSRAGADVTAPPRAEEAQEGVGNAVALRQACLAGVNLLGRVGRGPRGPATQERPAPQNEDASPATPAAEDTLAPLPGAPAVLADEGASAQPASPAPRAVQRASAEQTFETFSTATATALATRLPAFGEVMGRQFGTDRATVVEQAPPLRVALPGREAPSAAEAGPAPPAELPSAAALALPAPAEAAAPLPDLQTQVPPQPEGENVGTQAGPPPQFVPGGEAEPTRIGPVADQSLQLGQDGHRALADELAANRSADRLVPVGVDRSEALALPASTAGVGMAASAEMREYLATSVPANVRALADADFAPLLAASLAAPRQAVADAALERDAEQQRAFVEAQAEADRASADAQAEQTRLIADGRADIEAEQAQGVKDSEAKLAEFDTEVARQREDKRVEIAQTITTEQAKADAAVTTAEAQAVQEQATAKQNEETARQEAEARKPKEPKKKWYEKVADWFKDAINKWTEELTNAVKQVFETAKTIVRTALETAKKFAVGIIKTLRTTVTGMIQAFAASLKLLVGGLLFFFPQLRERVNAAIDVVVETTLTVVNKVAAGLETAVTELVDRVGSVVNRILDTFELVVVTSIALAQALLTGNFLEAAKILFLAACKAVGIPGEEFLGILADARDALLDIMKRPAAFLGNLLKAVGQGLSQFLANFPQRLLGGLTGWLFGQITEGGITVPTSFDLPSIFMLILQVMGLTYAHIRSRVVLQLGEKAVGVIEQVMVPIGILFKEGPRGLWHWLKDQAEQAKTAIVEAATQWLVTQIITQAAIKLATMFTPVGAFVQAVLMMYNTIMFFVEKIKEIFAWVKSITASMKAIAQGAIGAAAEYIDQSMAKAIPLIIAFLARLLGLGGIGEQIRAVVSKLRAPVDKALDFVIEKLIAGAKAAWGGVKAGARKVAHWWNATEKFTTMDGEEHRLYFEKDGQGTLQLMVASDPKDVDTFVKDQGTPASEDVIQNIKEHYQPLQKVTQPKEAEAGQQEEEMVACHMPGLGKALGKLPGKEEDESLGDKVMSAGKDLLAGALLGDFKEDPTYWNMIGQALVGFTPVGIAADVRDLIAALKRLLVDQKYGDPFEWLNLGLILVAFVPGLGDLIKLGGKATIKWLRKSGLVGRLLEKGVGVVKKAAESLKYLAQDMLEPARAWLEQYLTKIGAMPHAVPPGMGHGIGKSIAASFTFPKKRVQKNGIDYEVQQAIGELGVPGQVASPRNLNLKAEREMRESVSSGTGDHAGHLIGAQFGGPIVPENYSRQNWIQNTGGGTYYDLESVWKSKLQNGTRIHVEISDYLPVGADRPTHRIVTWTETIDGQKSDLHTVHFANSETVRSRTKGIEQGRLEPTVERDVPADVIDIFSGRELTDAEIAKRMAKQKEMRKKKKK